MTPKLEDMVKPNAGEELAGENENSEATPDVEVPPEFQQQCDELLMDATPEQLQYLSDAVEAKLKVKSPDATFSADDLPQD
jgi:trans-2-enoyl-CoA reductase